MKTLNRVLLIGAIVFVAIGACSMAYVTYVVVHARAHQQQAYARLVVSARLPAAAARAAREGDLLGSIHSARIRLSAAVEEGESAGVLQNAVGHVADTPAPGESGNVVLAGHRDTFFRPLRNIRVGDEITVTTAAGRDAIYEVDWTAVVSPEDVWVMEPTAARTLTLITCHPFSFVGAAPHRFIVRAHQRLESM